MPPGSIDRPTLRALTELTLRDIAPAQKLTGQTFADSLSWSMEPVATFAALVRIADHAGTERYQAFDAIVSWAQAHESPLPDSTWDFILAYAEERYLNSVALAATTV